MTHGHTPVGYPFSLVDRSAHKFTDPALAGMMRGFFPALGKIPQTNTLCFATWVDTITAPECATGSGHAGKAVSTQGTRHECAHRDSGGRNNFPGHGLHSVRQPEHPRRDRHGQGRDLRCHLSCSCHRLDHHGPDRQLPDRAGTGHGLERLLYLHRGPAHGPHLAGCPGRGVHFRRMLLPAFDLSYPGMDRQQHPTAVALGHCRRYRPIPGIDRPA
ncbi:hypothetical protein D9M71_457210 [compost metagenome]